MTKTQEDFFNKIFTSHFICKVWKGCSRFACERVLETEQKLQYFDLHSYDRQCCVFLVSWCSTGGLGSTLLGAGFLYCILTASSLDPNSSGLPEGLFGRVWLSFPHLVSNSVRSSTQLPATLLARRTQLSYIIVRHPLDLWNRMFNRHQVEITVMQFTGHSLPVHQSMSVPF